MCRAETIVKERKMKIKIMLAVPTTSNPNPKGWKTVIGEVVDLDTDQTIEEIMELLVKKLNG